jgi:hypothetical protein
LVYTAFVRALQTPEDEIPELRAMLDEGFVMSNGRWKRPDALTQAKLEERHQVRLFRQFEEYLDTAQAGGRLKEVRKEAVLAGFTEAYRACRFYDIVWVPFGEAPSGSTWVAFLPTSVETEQQSSLVPRHCT